MSLNKTIEERKVAILNRVMKDDSMTLIVAIESAISSHDAPISSKEYLVNLKEFAEIDFGRTKALGFEFDDLYLECSSWKEIYEEIIQLMFSRLVIDPKKMPIPDCHAGQRFMLNKEPVHKSGKAFTIPSEINGVYAECHYNANTLMKNISNALSSSKTLKADDFKLRFLK
jgi:hypothetical protein